MTERRPSASPACYLDEVDPAYVLAGALSHRDIAALLDRLLALSAPALDQIRPRLRVRRAALATMPIASPPTPDNALVGDLRAALPNILDDDLRADLAQAADLLTSG